jgi:hypothetical protein
LLFQLTSKFTEKTLIAQKLSLNYNSKGTTFSSEACPSKNFNIEKSWDSVVFALIFSEFGYVTDFFYAPDFFYVFLKNHGKNDKVPTFFYVFSKIYVVKNTSIFEKT